MNEDQFIKLYRELTGATEGTARSVYIFVADDARENIERKESNVSKS